MKTPTAALVGVATALLACGQTSPSSLPIDVVGFGDPPPPAIYTTEPVMPQTLTVGQRVSIRVWPSAPADYRVEFPAPTPSVRWIVADPPCPQNACADLLGVSASMPGEVELVTIGICPPPGTALCSYGRPHMLTVLPR